MPKGKQAHRVAREHEAQPRLDDSLPCPAVSIDPSLSQEWGLLSHPFRLHDTPPTHRIWQKVVHGAAPHEYPQELCPKHRQTHVGKGQRPWALSALVTEAEHRQHLQAAPLSLGLQQPLGWGWWPCPHKVSVETRPQTLQTLDISQGSIH